MTQGRRTRNEQTQPTADELDPRAKWWTTTAEDIGQAPPGSEGADRAKDAVRRDHHPAIDSEDEQVLELREERLVPHKQLREAGAVVIRTEVEEVPERVEVEGYREEVEIERIPIGQAVTERKAAWHEGETLVVPVYEERIVAVKRLILKEHVKIRRVGHRETHVFEETARRDRLVVEDPSDTGAVRERYSTEAYRPDGTPESESPGFMERIGKKLLG
jgi:uncharacterized protein (TIGR02271 family)